MSASLITNLFAYFCRFSVYVNTQTDLQATLVMRVWGSARDSISESWSIPVPQFTHLRKGVKADVDILRAIMKADLYF